MSQSDDPALRAALQTVRRRANLVRDAAIALDADHIRETELPGLIAALQEALTDLQLMAADKAARNGGGSSEVASTRTEWPADSAPHWPPPPREPRPWKQNGKKGTPHESS
jgi:hypothetical protein